MMPDSKFPTDDNVRSLFGDRPYPDPTELPEEDPKLTTRVQALLTGVRDGVVPVTPDGQRATCFKSIGGEPFVTFNGVTYPVPIGKNKIFESDLGLAIQRAWWQEADTILTASLLQDVALVLRASGKFGQRCIPVATRVGGDGAKRIVIDLGEPDNDDVIEVSPSGWMVRSLGNDETLRFLRPKGMQPLTRPTRSQSVIDRDQGSRERAPPIPALRALGLEEEAQRRCLVWLLNTLRPGDHPTPLLVVEGTPGSGKSVLTAELQRLTDPRTAGVRALPNSIRDLLACALNARVLSFTNASTVSPEMSDAMCRLASGEATATRTLFTTSGQVTCEGVRPIILNGVAGLLTRGDLADRALVVELPDRVETQPENVLRQRLQEVRSDSLGILCDLLSFGLRRLRDGEVDSTVASLHRMADAVVWSAACLGNDLGRLIWTPVAFDAHLRALDGWAPAEKLFEMIKASGSWEGRASDLGRLLRPDRPGEGWPKTPQYWARDLRLNQAALAEAGLRVEFLPRKNNVRRIRLIWIGGQDQ